MSYRRTFFESTRYSKHKVQTLESIENDEVFFCFHQINQNLITKT